MNRVRNDLEVPRAGAIGLIVPARFPSPFVRVSQARDLHLYLPAAANSTFFIAPLATCTQTGNTNHYSFVFR